MQELSGSEDLERLENMEGIDMELLLGCDDVCLDDVEDAALAAWDLDLNMSDIGIEGEQSSHIVHGCAFSARTCEYTCLKAIKYIVVLQADYTADCLLASLLDGVAFELVHICTIVPCTLPFACAQTIAVNSCPTRVCMLLTQVLLSQHDFQARQTPSCPKHISYE